MVPLSNDLNGFWLVLTEHLLSVRWWDEACNGGLPDVLKMRLIVPGTSTSLDAIALINGCSRNDSNDPKLTMLRLGNVSLDVAVDRIAKDTIGLYLVAGVYVAARSQLNYHKYDHVSPKDETVQARRHQPT